MKKLSLAASLAAALCVAQAADATELRLGMAAPAATPWGKVTEKFAATVAELSGGEVTISIYYNNELGDEQTMARQLPRGRLDMALLSNVAASLLVPEYGLLLSPYAFDSLAEADCVTDAHLSRTFDAAFQSAGAVLLSSIEVGQMVIMSQKPFRIPADMVGQKVRTSPTPTDTDYIDATGAAAVPLGTVDSMPALKTGAVVAVTTPIVMGVAAGYAAEAPQITLTGHGHQLGALLVSKKTWDALGDKERAAITEAAQTMDELRPAVRAAEQALLEKAKTAGAIVHTPTSDEKAAWKSFAAQAQEQILSDLGDNAPQVWADLLSAKQACAK
ncbi:TRAP transporter substrate-binding protein DctP [Mesorhizobium sp. L-8-3]|uniref:TRAP transporter substrate-binding protein DctP n=1 Tax=Mesorhizobium sp. L-8-3 TaxID=2744522 RepID=UPI0019279D76|nr:TRAP transporter substrate-binding protein DctP [Mesorhizobium sp. L-8-3]BCH20566.1 C4-dicarboxylate ABC transporter substrate-binding protein [Mesorhizobium sp. L-8-3]